MKPAALSFAFLFAARLFAAEHDIVIYGGTSAAVVSAVGWDSPTPATRR